MALAETSTRPATLASRLCRLIALAGSFRRRYSTTSTEDDAIEALTIARQAVRLGEACDGERRSLLLGPLANLLETQPTSTLLDSEWRDIINDREHALVVV